MLETAAHILLGIIMTAATGSHPEGKAPSAAARDGRNIRTGHTIPSEGYCDQPYVVVTKEGKWLCVLTTGPGKEGDKGQHVVSTVSADEGRTWSKLVDIEPSAGTEASWATLLVVPSGRVYAFYTYNGDNVRTLAGKKIRADTIGWYAYRYTDDEGRSWSKQRYRLPLRLTACDRGNDWKGKRQIFWGIDEPSVVDGSVFFAFTKLGKYMLERGEGWMFRSDNILTERDPERIRWTMLPEGDRGISRKDFGSVQEEHNAVPLRDGAIYCMYRTTRGYPAHAYSRDGGRTWTKPEFATYTPGGRRIKNPRACPKVWKTRSGRYLLWYHNHGGRGFKDRNPVWIAGGAEVDGRLHWSQPEILLYDADPVVRMSYPSLIEQDGRFWVTETQKTEARVHEIDQALLEGMWNQGKAKTVAQKDLLLDVGGKQLEAGRAALPGWLDLRKTGGVTVEAWIRRESLATGAVLVDGRDDGGRGVCLTATPKGAIRAELHDGTAGGAWTCDAGVLKAKTVHHVVAVIDNGPRIISFIVDGVLCDGGEAREYGWGRYEKELGDVTGSGVWKTAASQKGVIKRLRVYGRALRTSEAVANYHAGP